MAADGVLSVLHGTLRAMSADTRDALAWLVAYQHGVLSRPQIFSAGFTKDWLRTGSGPAAPGSACCRAFT